jgi:hypothetical protein
MARALDFDHVTGRGGVQRGLQVFAGAHAQGGGLRRPARPSEQRAKQRAKHQPAHQSTQQNRAPGPHASRCPLPCSSRNSAAPINKFLKPT